MRSYFPFSILVILCVVLVAVVEVVVNALQQEVEEELLDAELCVGPVLRIELFLVEFYFGHRAMPALFHLGAKSLKSSIFLIHYVLEACK